MICLKQVVCGVLELPVAGAIGIKYLCNIKVIS